MADKIQIIKVPVNLPSTNSRTTSAWPAAAACICFFVVTLELFNTYGLLHWKIIRDHYSSLGEMKPNLFRLLTHLEIYRATALASVVFGVWAFFGEPRWVRFLCLPICILAFSMIFVSA
ncbi:MAG: hypothetical protein ABIQ35_14030 [Verrucomicrobiota bacterium]